MTDNANSTADQALKNYIDRIERLEAEKAENAAEYAADIKEVYEEAKGMGFNVKAIKSLIRERKVKAARDGATASDVELYKQSIGMTPMEQAITDNGGEPGRDNRPDKAAGTGEAQDHGAGNGDAQDQGKRKKVSTTVH